MDLTKLKYSDANDKCLGVVGMAIGLNIWEAEDMYAGIALDAEGFDCIEFTSNLYFSESPAISPKMAWRHHLKLYKLMVGLTLSNILCRSIVGDKGALNSADRRSLLDLFSREGEAAELALTQSECTDIFNRSYNYLVRLYNMQQVQTMVKTFADTLAERRHMSSLEVADVISILNS